jgi:hypothetical protein
MDTATLYAKFTAGEITLAELAAHLEDAARAEAQAVNEATGRGGLTINTTAGR